MHYATDVMGGRRSRVLIYASGEDDLAARGEMAELADGDDVLKLIDQVVLGEPGQVD